MPLSTNSRASISLIKRSGLLLNVIELIPPILLKDESPTVLIPAIPPPPVAVTATIPA